MRRRSIAVFMLLAAVFGGFLSGAAPASAVDFKPACTSEARGHPNEIDCRAAAAGDRTLTSVNRALDGGGISFFDCDTGAALIVCTVAINGGTPPFRISWLVNGVEQPFFRDSSILRVGCVVGRSFTVQVIVLDAAGILSTDQTGGVCSRIQQ